MDKIIVYGYISLNFIFFYDGKSVFRGKLY